VSFKDEIENKEYVQYEVLMFNTKCFPGVTVYTRV